jgi:hypothetical protein
MELSHYLKDCHLYIASQSSIELIPERQAAVYAFYEMLAFESHSLIDDIDSHVTKYGREVKLSKDDWPFKLHIDFRGNPKRFRGAGRKICKKLDKSEVSKVRDIVKFLSFLNEPLYIGKTEDLRIRFAAHHDKDFLFKMKDKYNRPPNEFLLFAFFCEPNYARLLESIFLQIINPPHCDQKT